VHVTLNEKFDIVLLSLRSMLLLFLQSKDHLHVRVGMLLGSYYAIQSRFHSPFFKVMIKAVLPFLREMGKSME
jgi:hypothetical protein